MAAKGLFLADERWLFEQLADGSGDLDELSASTGTVRPRATHWQMGGSLNFVERHGKCTYP